MRGGVCTTAAGGGGDRGARGAKVMRADNARVASQCEQGRAVEREAPRQRRTKGDKIEYVCAPVVLESAKSECPGRLGMPRWALDRARSPVPRARVVRAPRALGRGPQTGTTRPPERSGVAQWRCNAKHAHADSLLRPLSTQHRSAVARTVAGTCHPPRKRLARNRRQVRGGRVPRSPSHWRCVTQSGAPRHMRRTGAVARNNERALARAQ